MSTHPPKTVLAIPGSLRTASYNRGLVATAAAMAIPGLTVRVYDELATIPLYSEDLESSTVTGPEPVRRLRALVGEADGVLFSTPEYNQSIPGVLKNAVDWLSRPLPDEVLSGRPVAIVGVSGGRWGTRLAQAALRHVLLATESLVMVEPPLFIREAERLFDRGGLLTDAETRRQLEQVLHAFRDWIELVGPDHSQPSSARSAHVIA